MNKKKKFLNFFKQLDVFSYKLEGFFEKHKRKAAIGFLFIFIGLIGYFSYQKWYVTPREEKAFNLFFDAKDFFSKNNKGDTNELEKALLNKTKEGYFGFLDIIKKYPYTKGAHFSHFYAGLCFYKLKQYKKAITYWEAFSAKDAIVSTIKKGMIGDAFLELGEKKSALSYYLEAAKKENELTQTFYYRKAILLSLSMGDYTKAKECISSIQKNKKYIQEVQKKHPGAMLTLSLDVDKYEAFIKYKEALKK